MINTKVKTTKNFEKLTEEKQKKFFTSVNKAIKETAKEIRNHLKDEMRKTFKVRNKKFLNLATTKVYDKRKDELNAFLAYYKNIDKENSMMSTFVNNKRVTSKKNMLINTLNISKFEFKKMLQKLRKENLLIVRNSTIFAKNTKKTLSILTTTAVKNNFTKPKTQTEQEKKALSDAKKDYRKSFKKNLKDNNKSSLIRLAVYAKTYKHKTNLPPVDNLEQLSYRIFRNKVNKIDLDNL